ncbi:hypothetical protein LOK49_LG11G02669 [Camellia lanceoleosa]|uniref:Uncharacterized protein n=1 Tax=Camellia lanceoleosa TaxID=1840588 RepID=A0ACC0G3S6_9ERIC|nr:hypothetical protein LOK49_LG11G02669 [Camellia lanceoleosa]
MIINRFLSRGAPLNSGTHQLVESHRSACVRDLNLQLTHVQALLDVEKQRDTALDQLRMAVGQGEHYWPSSFGGGGGGFLDGQSSFGGGAGGSSFQAGPSFAKGGVRSPFQTGPSFPGGCGFGVLPFGAGPGSFGAGGGGSDNNGIVPFDGRVPDAGGSKSPYGFNHGYGRGFY